MAYSNRDLLSHISGGLTYEIKVLGRLCSLESLEGRILPCLLQLLMAVGVSGLPQLHHSSLCFCLFVFSLLSLIKTQVIGFRAHQENSE